MKKSTKFAAVFISVLMLTAGMAACTAEKGGAESNSTDPSQTTVQTTEGSTAAPEETETGASGTASESSTAKEAKTSAKSSTTKKQSSGGASDFTIKEALDALQNYYGDGYSVNGTISEEDFYYFSVYKKDKKYASVKVNMKNGDAVETITETGEKNNLNLFV